MFVIGSLDCVAAYTVKVDGSGPVRGLGRTATCRPPYCPPEMDSDDPNGAPSELPSDTSEDLTIDFGFIPPPATLQGRVWFDRDVDGVRDPDEPGLEGVRVRLYRNGVVESVSTTGGSGGYSFGFPGCLAPFCASDLAFVVCVQVFDDYRLTAPGSFCSPPVLPGYGVLQELDFGYGQSDGIGGRVWHDSSTVTVTRIRPNQASRDGRSACTGTGRCS